MDPGTAVGVASLGIQVCEGLLAYYREWKGYQADIEEVCTMIEDLKESLELLDNKLKSSSDTAFIERAKKCLLACQDGIAKLNEKLNKVHKKTPSGTKQKLQAAGLRSIYPFQKKTLDNFKAAVQDLMRQLDSAVQIIVLDNTDATRATTEQIQITTGQLRNSTDHIQNTTDQVQTLALDIQSQVSDVAVHLERKERDELLNWLAAPDRSIEHDIARAKHEVGTGEWLLRGKEYQDWITGNPPLLWLHGKAGCCKTVLCSTIVVDIEQRLHEQSGTAFAYFYFTFADPTKQSYRSLLLSMILELSRIGPIHKSLVALHRERKPHTASVEALQLILISMLKQASVSYLVVDALDECSEDQRDEVLEGLHTITKSNPGTRLLVTSRKEADIEDYVSSWGVTALTIDEAGVNADIDLFVEQKLASHKKLMRLPDETKEEIKRVFHEKSDGMFRWADLQLQAICKLKILRPTYVSHALYEMPRTLYETYQRMLSSIDELYFAEAQRALEWLAFSNVTLSIAEFAEVCGLVCDHHETPCLPGGAEDEFEAAMGLLNVLGSLVVLGERKEPYARYADEPLPEGKYNPDCYCQEVRLAHFSVKEYLVSEQLRDSASGTSRYALDEVQGNFKLGQMCCAYLMYFTAEPGQQDWINTEEMSPMDLNISYFGNFSPLSNLDRLRPGFPLLGYSAQQWYSHIAFAERGMASLPGETLFHLQVLETEKATATWLRLANDTDTTRGEFTETYWFRSSKIQELELWHDKTRALFWASYCKLPLTISLLCYQVSRPDFDGDHVKFGTALQAAAYWDDEELITLLLERASDVNVQGGPFENAYLAAARGGNERILSKLLEANFGTIHSTDLTHGTLLWSDSKRKSLQIADLLLGIDVSVTGRPQSAAMLSGAEKIVASLQTVLKSVKEDIIKSVGHTSAHVLAMSSQPFQDAAALNNEEICETLARVSMTTQSILDGLLIFAVCKRDEIIDLWISCGANITISAFHEAVYHIGSLSKAKAHDALAVRVKYESIAELLLQSNPSLSNDPLALTAATSSGSTRITKFLLNAGAEVDAHATPKSDRVTDWRCKIRPLTENALVIAIRNRDVTNAQILLDAGADINKEFPILLTSAEGVQLRAIATPMIFAILLGVKNSGWDDALTILKICLDANIVTMGNALCKFYECYFFVNYPLEKKYDLDLMPYTMRPIIETLLERHEKVVGPLASIPYLLYWTSQHFSFRRIRKIGLALLGRYSIQSVAESATHTSSKPWTWRGLSETKLPYFSLFLSGALLGHEEILGLLSENEAEVEALTITQACDIFAAACWTYIRPKDCDKFVTMVAKCLLQIKGKDDEIFDQVLSDGQLEISMGQYLNPEQRDDGVARVKRLVQECRAALQEA
ncbi:hypothetical protein CC86DRAFT_430515 [Ophiobolus disseminans]|uniref:NACHT domain-containing protein n=1 Tax=Ophiobolus disseminans TaxID=1469910 RepID=A0A6A7ACH7_9PLEO|nr:hypothetical protein CC86DRAFT_430515 [Ophiobolus disseminans]